MNLFGGVDTVLSRCQYRCQVAFDRQLLYGRSLCLLVFLNNMMLMAQAVKIALVDECLSLQKDFS